MHALRTPKLSPTGRYRLRAAGEVVVLQAEEATSFPHAPHSRWVDVTPQDLIDGLQVEIRSGAIKIG